MRVVAAVHQPQYLPWLGYFDKIRHANVFCFLDNVQYKKNEWQNRNRIKTATGWQWLTVPVHYRFPQTIDTVTIDTRTRWERKHLQALKTNYGRAPYYRTVMEMLGEVYDGRHTLLADLNIALIERLRAALGASGARTVRASTMNLSTEPSQRLVDICRHLGADTYLAGAGGRNYMDLAPFRRAGIEVRFQKYRPSPHRQLFGAFQSNLSAADLLFNCGPGALEERIASQD